MAKKHQQPTRGVPDPHCDKNGESGTLRRAQPLTRKEKMAEGEKEAAEKRAKNRTERRGNATNGGIVRHYGELKENRATRRGNDTHPVQRGDMNDSRTVKNKNKEAHRHQNRTFSKEDDPDDAVWSKIEKRQAQRAAAKERRRTGNLNKGQRLEERNRKEKTLNLKDMRVPIDSIMQNDAGDMVVAIPEEYQTEDVLTQMKKHFASKHPSGTVEEMRDEDGEVTGLHWAKDEGETEPLVSIEGEEVTVAVTASTEEEAVAKLQERLQHLTGDPELILDSPVNRHEPEPDPEPNPRTLSTELAHSEETGGPRRKSRVVERGYERNHKLVGLAKRRADYRCEVKGCTVELFVKPDGHRYVEVHHLIMMAEGGPDTLENMVCLCPNHHRELHYGENGKSLKKQLQCLRSASIERETTTPSGRSEDGKTSADYTPEHKGV
jgi:hypothetical protein